MTIVTPGPGRISEGHAYTVETQAYVSEIRYLQQDLIYLERSHRFSKSTTLIDAYASNWFLGLCEQSGAGISVRSGRTWHRVNGPSGVYVPPFSIIGWRLDPGHYRWKALVSAAPPPSSAPKTPVVFPWDGKLPGDLSEVFQLISVHPEGTLPLAQQSSSSITAARAKQYLEQHYKENIQVQKIADAMGLSRGSLASLFKAVYGLSPVAYRHRLRIFEAMRLMNRGWGVTEAIFEAGFSTPSQAIHHFRAILGTTPVQNCAKANPRRFL